MNSLFLLIAALYTLNPVTISVYPHVAMPPATFRITVLVPRHFDNRKLCYQVDGPERKASCMNLDGWQSRRTWTVYWTLRGSGDYEASATLTRIVEGETKTFTAREPFRVVGTDVF